MPFPSVFSVSGGSSGGGSGNVTGPGSSTNLAIATFSGTGGKTLLNNANATIDASGNIYTTNFFTDSALNGATPEANESIGRPAATTITSGYGNLVIGPNKSGDVMAITTGHENTLIGIGTGQDITTASCSVAIGAFAGSNWLSNGNNARNCYIGWQAGFATAGTSAEHDNTIVGCNSLGNTYSGNQSTGVGAGVMFNASTASDVVAVGFQAASALQAGASGAGQIVCIGSNCNVALSTTTDATAVGYNLTVASHQCKLGTATQQTAISGQTPLTTAWLTLPIGTSSCHGLNIPTGTVLATPINGTVEFDGSYYYGSIGSTRYNLSANISARYHGSTTVISGTTAAIAYSASDYDTNSAYSGSTFTAPIAGKYQVSANLDVSGTIALNNTLIVYINKNGATVAQETVYAGGAVTAFSANIIDTLSCAVNDTIQIVALSTAISPVIVTSNVLNYVTFRWTGN